MSFEIDMVARLIDIILTSRDNIPPDAYPGAIPPGYGGFLPGFPGSELPRIPVPGLPGSDQYHEASENCRNVYNGLNAQAQDEGYHRAGPGGEMTVENTEVNRQAKEAMDSCKRAGWNPNVY